MRRLTAATAAAVLVAGMLLTPGAAATAQVPRKCRIIAEHVDVTRPGVWTVREQLWRCLSNPGQPGYDEIRYHFEVH